MAGYPLNCLVQVEASSSMRQGIGVFLTFLQVLSHVQDRKCHVLAQEHASTKWFNERRISQNANK